MDHARPRGRPGWLDAPRATSRQGEEGDPVRAGGDRRRSIAMLPAGTPALNRDEALVLLAETQGRAARTAEAPAQVEAR